MSLFSLIILFPFFCFKETIIQIEQHLINLNFSQLVDFTDFEARARRTRRRNGVATFSHVKKSLFFFSGYIMLLGFTRLEKPRRASRTHWILWALVLSTALGLFAMVDSFYLHLFSTAQRHEQQQCAMSYAYPTFTEITNKPNSTLSAKYKLYLYREGYLDGPDQVYHATHCLCLSK